MESALRAGADAPGLKLIETMLWDGVAYPRLALHLARMSLRMAFADSLPRATIEKIIV